MTRPSVDRFFSVVCRNAATSYVTNAADVSSSTELLISRRSTVSFFLIGQSRSDISRPRWIDDLGHPQELGADGQVCRLDHPEVDLEPARAPAPTPGSTPPIPPTLRAACTPAPTGRSEMPFERPIDAALDLAARGRRTELGVMIMQQILTGHGELELRNRLPLEAHI